MGAILSEMLALFNQTAVWLPCLSRYLD